MAKKYLNLEDVASQLGITVAELNRLRESGEIRGFADRGTWKFKPEDVEELARSRQADSDPAVPILDTGVKSPGKGEGSSVILTEGGEGSSVVLSGEEEGSSVVLSADGDGSSVLLSEEEDDVGREPTIIRKAGSKLSDASDSDVRLVLDDSLTADSSPDIAIVKEKDSDSDVRLVGDSVKDDSDSDVQLVSDTSDSDVKLVEPGSAKATDDSDSDVKLVGDTPHSDILLDSGAASDSDVQLIGSDVVTDRDIPLADDKPDSGIALAGADDSGISLMADDDSGISLAADEDSGISLASPTDSGIALEALADDSGISVVKSDLDETQFEFDALDGDSEFELSSKPSSGTGSDTGVIVFDDDADDFSPTVVKPGAAAAGAEDIGAGETFEFDDGLDVADDVLGEDDDLDDVDVFDAGDEDFAQSFDSGESHAEFISPAGAVAAPVEQDWGIATFIGLALTTAVMALCAMVMFDFVRAMWSFHEPTGFTGTVMKQIGGLFKK